MPKLLTEMVIDEISVVDDPAAEDARMVIVKSKGGFKPCDGCEDPAGCMKKGACAAKAEKAAVPLIKMANAVVAAMDSLADEIVAKAMSEGLSDHPGAEDAVAAFLKENLMDLEAIQKALEEATAKIDKQAADIVALTKRAEAAETEVAKAKGKGADDDEEVMKNLPEAVRKRLEEATAKAAAAEAAIAKMAEKAETDASIAKAREANLPEPEKIGPALTRVAKGKSTPEDAALIETALKAASAQAKAGKLFATMGGSVAVDGDPEAMLKAKAEEIQKANAGMTYADAYTKAMDENPALYNAYVSKRRGFAA